MLNDSNVDEMGAPIRVLEGRCYKAIAAWSEWMPTNSVSRWRRCDVNSSDEA